MFNNFNILPPYHVNFPFNPPIVADASIFHTQKSMHPTSFGQAMAEAEVFSSLRDIGAKTISLLALMLLYSQRIHSSTYDSKTLPDANTT